MVFLLTHKCVHCLVQWIFQPILANSAAAAADWFGVLVDPTAAPALMLFASIHGLHVCLSVCLSVCVLHRRRHQKTQTAN